VVVIDLSWSSRSTPIGRDHRFHSLEKGDKYRHKAFNDLPAAEEGMPSSSIRVMIERSFKLLESFSVPIRDRH